MVTNRVFAPIFRQIRLLSVFASVPENLFSIMVVRSSCCHLFELLSFVRVCLIVVAVTQPLHTVRSFAPLHTVRSQPLHTVRSQPMYTVRASLFDCIGMLWHCIKLSMRLKYTSSIPGRAIVIFSWTCPCSMVPIANLCCRMEIVPFNARPGCVLGAYRTTTGMLHVSWNAALH